MPTISVIIPTYNRAHLLSRAVLSVLNQTYKDFEIIVVDDASTDNTYEVVKSFNDPRIKYIHHEQNKGSAAARNTGIKSARGEYIAFQDSDDEWLPEKLNKQMEIFNRASPQVGVVYSGFYHIDGGNRKYVPDYNTQIPEGNIFEELLKKNYVGTPAAIIRKVCFEKVGMFEERLLSLEDWELFIRISKFYEFKFIKDPLLNAFFSPGSVSSNKTASLEAYKLILERHIHILKENRYLLANIQYSIGNLLCQAGDMNEGKIYLIQALRSNPLKIKYIGAVFLSVFGKDTYASVCKLKRLIRPVDTA